MLKIVSKKVTGLCSNSNPSLLRRSGQKDLEKFNLQLVLNKWHERAPVFYSFLLTTCINKRTKDSTWFGSLALAGSILLKQKNAEMSATASLMGVLLKSKSIEVCSSFYKCISLHCSLAYLSMIHLGTLSLSIFFFLPSKFPQLVTHRIVHAICFDGSSLFPSKDNFPVSLCHALKLGV